MSLASARSHLIKSEGLAEMRNVSFVKAATCIGFLLLAVALFLAMQHGRYTLQTAGAGAIAFRLDTLTGEVSACIFDAGRSMMVRCGESYLDSLNRRANPLIDLLKANP